MNKKTLVLLVVIFVVVLISTICFINFLKINQKDIHGCLINKGYSWCDFENKCIKKGEECNLTKEWILNEAKKIIGLDLNLMPNEFIKWNTQEGKIVFSSQGYYYSDLLKAERIMRGFKDLEEFLNKAGLEKNPDNPPTLTDKESIVKYSKDKIVCELKRTDNPNNTSSLSLFCGDIDDRLCSFESDCGRECNFDSDCDFVVDGCRKIIVCRAKGYNFFNDCKNPTSNVSELDLSINSCICLENQCVPEKEEVRFKN